MIDPEVFIKVPIFSLLDADERQILAQQVNTRNFAKGEIIFQSGDAGGYAYLVQSGHVNLSTPDMEDENIGAEVLNPGDVFGMSSLLARSAHRTTAIAGEDTSAIEIDRNDIQTLLQKKPHAGLDMMTMIETQLRNAQDLMRTQVSRNPNTEIEESTTPGDRTADVVARLGGSWKFVITFGVLLIAYIWINSLLKKPWDPYPFILLNLVLSMLTAFQAPVIMMSQNRQDTKDRLRSELDYRVNSKSELEIEEVLQRISRIEHRLADTNRP